MRLGKKKQGAKTLLRSPNRQRAKQQAYHYSAKRSSSDRAFDRTMITDNPASSGYRSWPETILSIFGVLLFLAGAIYVMTLSTNAQIKVKDNRNLPNQSDVQKKADAILGSSLTNRSKFTIDTRKFEETLSSEFPELSDIHLSISMLRHKPLVTIQIANPALSIVSGNKEYVVGDDGVVMYDINNVPSSSKTPKDLPVVQDQSSFDIEVGKQVLTVSQIKFIDEITYQLSQKNISTESMIIKGGGGELQLRPGGELYYVRFNFFEDAIKSSGTYLAVREKLKADNVVVSEYIDVRVPERAYVK